MINCVKKNTMITHDKTQPWSIIKYLPWPRSPSGTSSPVPLHRSRSVQPKYEHRPQPRQTRTWIDIPETLESWTFDAVFHFWRSNLFVFFWESTNQLNIPTSLNTLRMKQYQTQYHKISQKNPCTPQSPVIPSVFLWVPGIWSQTHQFLHQLRCWPWTIWHLVVWCYGDSYLWWWILLQKMCVKCHDFHPLPACVSSFAKSNPKSCCSCTKEHDIPIISASQTIPKSTCCF